MQEGEAEEALQQLRQIIGKIKLTVNEEKNTNTARSRKGSSTSSVYVWAVYSARTGKRIWGIGHRRKSVKRMVENVHALTVRAEPGERPQGW